MLQDYNSVSHVSAAAALAPHAVNVSVWLLCSWQPAGEALGVEITGLEAEPHTSLKCMAESVFVMLGIKRCDF